MDLRTALRTTAERLAARDDLRDRARQDARQLMEIATGLSRVQQLAASERELTDVEHGFLDALIARRLCAEPIQHLRGSQEFYGRDLLVTPDVLIPRPETEDIVTAVLETFPLREMPLHIADVGAGSGALALTLALEYPASEVVALDLSPAALIVARQNAERLGIGRRVRFVASDLFAALLPAERFDVIVSNPPYIPLSDAATLHPEVRDHEPHLALFAGADGHDIYRRLIPEARERLVPAGLLVLETGGRVDLIQEWLHGWDGVRVRPDLQGIARVVTARRH